ncbi:MULTISPECIES: hypothetical protein [unclassified Frankia]|uniref:hypothetical protein n=1 Tax=unclassified Frankia TaxID=2632575 RepID=UPI001EF4B3CD|nr:MULTISPECIES: hypothetical protein [unclassified Frankia]
MDKVRGCVARVSTLDGSVELTVQAGVGPDELIRVLAMYVPPTVGLESVAESIGGGITLRFVSRR